MSTNTAPIRVASCYMTYGGNCCIGIRERIDSLIPMGPNYMGEPMWPVSAEYDPASQKTRVGFTLVPPPEFLEAMAADFARFGKPVKA